MFAKSKVSQSMIDAVNKVLGEQPTQTAQPVQQTEVKEELLKEGWDDMVKDAKEKVKSGPKPSGGAGKKEGSRYGGSKQKDEKEPVKEELKGNQTKIDKNKNNKIDAEDFKLLRKEELKGNQTKIDANHNNKIDGQDFAILRGKKKKMREHLNDMPFAKKLLEKELDEGLMKKAFKALTGGSDEDQRKDLQRKMGIPQTGKKPESEIKYAAKTLVKHAKDPLGLKKEEVVAEGEDKYAEHSKKIQDLAQAGKEGEANKLRYELNRLLMLDRDKKRRQERGVAEGWDDMVNEVLSKDASAGDWIHDFIHSDNPKFAGKSKAERKKMALGAYYGKQNEEADVTTDSLAGRKDGGDENTFTHFKKKLKGDVQPDPKEDDNPEETAARKLHIAKPTDPQTLKKVDNLDKKYGTPNVFKEEKEEPPFEKPYRETKSSTVTDKSGAKHTPMSRARDLAQSALKKVKDKTKIKEAKW